MSTINVTNLSGRGGATPNLPDGANITGVATASGGFSGTLTGTGLTTGSDGSINVTSIKTVGVSTLGNVVITGAVGGGATVGAYAGVTTFYGDGSSLTGVGETIAPHYYNPDVKDVQVPLNTGIGITFNKRIEAGSGTATIKIVNAGVAGTTVQSWGISSATINVTNLTLGALVSNLDIRTTYQVDIPSGFVVDSNETSYVGTAYTFTAIEPSYKLWAWGKNEYGMLDTGLAHDAHRSSPVQIPGITWKTLGMSEGGGVHVTRTDGTLWGWGRNNYGQLGVNSETEYSSPVQIPGTTWADCYGTTQSWLATRSDGTLWAWGYNNSGALGLNEGSNAHKSSPVQIPGTTWSTFPTSGYHSSTQGAIKSDGTLWVWGGANEYGWLGQNSVVSHSSPVQIPGTSWRSFTLYQRGGMQATRTDGTFWAWGWSDDGMLGLNNTEKYSSPVQIPGTTWGAEMSAGIRYGANVKTDGTLWMWGINSNGQLGQNQAEATQYSSPVQIPGTTWEKLYKAGGAFYASRKVY